MGFYGTDFIYDGTSAQSLGVMLSSNKGANNTGTSMNYETHQLNSGEVIILGSRYNGALTFQLNLVSMSGELDRRTISRIINWLTGKREYKKLQIIQAGMEDMYYMCYMDSPTIFEIGNVPYGMSFNVVCDAPWAYENTKTKILNFTSYSNDIKFENYSDSFDDLIPSKIMVRALNDGAIRIINKTYGDRVTEIIGCTANEVITMNERLGLVETSKQIKVLERFNKKFLRMLPNINELKLENVQQIVIEYQFIRKIGG